MNNLTFITGAARSGKSLLAEELASNTSKSVYYMASMQTLEEDQEQIHRLQLHRQRRPADWHTIDAPFAAHKIVENLPAGESCVIFDCLSLYVTNILITSTSSGNANSNPYLKEAEVMKAVELLLTSMSARVDIEFIIVSNEVGWGVVPETRLGRAFRDFLGITNQLVAAKANKVYLSCAGLRLQLK